MKLTESNLREMIREELLREKLIWKISTGIDKHVKAIENEIKILQKRLVKSKDKSIGDELFIIGRAWKDIQEAKFTIVKAVQRAVKKDKSIEK